MSTGTLALSGYFSKRRTAVADRTASDSDDSVLLHRFLTGDDDAFLTLFYRHNRRIVTYCLKMVGRIELAEDLAQETWARVIALRNRPSDVYNPVGFLLRVARNLCLDHIRARKTHLSIDELHESAHPVQTLPEFSELEEMALAALDQLPFKYREVLVLQMYCGYKLEEIAEMLGKTPDAIWARASRARAQIRDIVMKQCGVHNSHNGGSFS